MHGLTIGNGCAIAWGCQFIDEDFHEVIYEGKRNIEKNDIVIGDNVWIGCNVIILKGASVARGSVVAAGSIVNSKFEEENVLIAGNPAKIVRHGVVWH